MNKNIPKTEDEWKEKLTEEEYKVLREKGTEAPFTDKNLSVKADGTFVCKGCGNPLFSSNAKFESGSGWPSFDETLPGAVKYNEDTSHGMNRTEILCAKCDSHLGHLFDDGPTPTGKRYCINSVCLDMEEK